MVNGEIIQILSNLVFSKFHINSATVDHRNFL